MNNLQMIATVAFVVVVDDDAVVAAAAAAAAAEGNVAEFVAASSSLVDAAMVLNAEAALSAHLHLEILVPSSSLPSHH